MFYFFFGWLFERIAGVERGGGGRKVGVFLFIPLGDEGVNGKLDDYKMGLNNRALKDITFI